MPEYRELNGSPQKQCSQCKEWRRPEGFPIRKSSADLLGSICNRCCVTNSKKWAENNPEKAKEINKKAAKKYRQRKGLVNQLFYT